MCDFKNVLSSHNFLITVSLKNGKRFEMWTKMKQIGITLRIYFKIKIKHFSKSKQQTYNLDQGFSQPFSSSVPLNCKI